ncbi:hypothetical protein ACH4LE_10240 [Streptomyces sp. NPDC017413]|uniref:hypothetical protein n=1 Tax=Streptomyces sp. NPDC017413 TaxID=3364994 RepID=UPI0037A95A14
MTEEAAEAMEKSAAEAMAEGAAEAMAEGAAEAWPEPPLAGVSSRGTSATSAMPSSSASRSTA